MSGPGPDPVELIRSGIEAMPYNRLLGVRVVAMENGRARALLPARAELANHTGAVHPAAQVALIEAAGGAAVSSGLVDLVGEATPLVQGVDVDYLRAAVGDLAAGASLAPASAEAARRGLAADGHVRFAVEVTVTDATGAVVTQALQRWLLRRVER